MDSFSAVLLKIRNDTNGKKYLYYILDIKNTGIQLSFHPEGSAIKGANNAPAGQPVNAIIVQDGDNVKFSLKER